MNGLKLIQLCLNIKKTKYILFQPNNAQINFDVFIDV